MTAPAPRDQLRQQLAEALCASEHPHIQPTLIRVYDTGDPRHEVAACYGCERNARALLPVVESEIAAAEQRGRDSVGLGDFMVITCDEEIRSPYILDAYGEWLSCSRREGHDGEHEHSESGYTWPEDDDLRAGRAQAGER